MTSNYLLIMDDWVRAEAEIGVTSEQSTPGIGKLWPVDQIQPATRFHTACKLRMVCRDEHGQLI